MKYNRPPSEMLGVWAKPKQEHIDILTRNAELIKHLAGVSEFKAGIDVVKPKKAAVAIADATEVYVHGMIDPTAEREKLEKQKEQLQQYLKGVQAKLANENFVKRAKPEVVEQSRARETELKDQLAVVEKHLVELG